MKLTVKLSIPIGYAFWFDDGSYRSSGVIEPTTGEQVLRDLQCRARPLWPGLKDEEITSIAIDSEVGSDLLEKLTGKHVAALIVGLGKMTLNETVRVVNSGGWKVRAMGRYGALLALVGLPPEIDWDEGAAILMGLDCGYGTQIEGISTKVQTIMKAAATNVEKLN